MKIEKMCGLVAAPFTPMTENGEINPKIVEQCARHLINNRVTGAFVCGTTGEGISMTSEERKIILEEWVRCSGSELKVICHVGSTSLPQSVELADHAEKSGAYAIAAFAPFFFRPGPAAELVSFFEPVAAAAPGIPFYYYHFPALTGIISVKPASGHCGIRKR